ncbi:lipopolysaccharide assembly protein LapA domain-containing protein [Almyronema epifaneia]|uniref:Lipopolysaccharide assembly protein LapA domain-containing protein n=1 Tax=Almyronema epifaneia S1 TaxID=2991925 RepID=A0ABW6IBL3_9CYAN
MRLFIVAALAIALLAILFAVQNTNLVTINLLTWQFRESLALVLLATLAIGVVIGLLVSMPALIRRDWRNSRFKRQVDSLEAQITAAQQDMAAQSEKQGALRESYDTLLGSLGLMDSVTGLLHQKALPQTVSSLLRRLYTEVEDPHYRSVCLFLMQAEPTAQQTGILATQEKLLWQAIADILQQNAAVESWLYSDGKGQFACTATGLDEKQAADYGEALQAFVVKNSVPLQDGSVVDVNLSVGGAIANRSHPTDGVTLLQQATEALNQAQQRGRNRFRLLQVSA